MIRPKSLFVARETSFLRQIAQFFQIRVDMRGSETLLWSYQKEVAMSDLPLPEPARPEPVQPERAQSEVGMSIAPAQGI